MAEDKRVGRRRFFREGLRELLKPLAESVRPLEQAIRQLDQLDQRPSKPLAAPLAVPARPTPAGTTPNRSPSGAAAAIFLRPPGALPEAAFQDACTRCGDCVAVCPVQAIKIDSVTGAGGGFPYIDAEATPCVVCTGLHCMNTCPSGALTPVPLVDIDMGTARWNPASCLRTQGTQEDPCRICLDDCPLGSAAITLQHGRIHVIEQGCIGCGVCQNHCPTTPKSIVVEPAQ